MEIIAGISMLALVTVGFFVGFYCFGSMNFTRRIVFVWAMYVVVPAILCASVHMYDMCMVHLLYSLFMVIGHEVRQIRLQHHSREHC